MSKSLSILIQHVNISIKLATFTVKNALQNKFINLQAFNQFVLYFKMLKKYELVLSFLLFEIVPHVAHRDLVFFCSLIFKLQLLF